MEKKEIICDKYIYLSEFRDIKLKEIIEKIKNEEPITIVKFGDGEFRNILQSEGSNIDNNIYYKGQGKALLLSYIFFLENSNTLICKWSNSIYPEIEKIDRKKIDLENDKFLYYDIINHILSPSEKFNKLTIEFYKEIFKSKLKKFYISNPMNIYKLKNFQKIDYSFEIPKNNSWLLAVEIIENVKKQLIKINEKIIVLVSGGMFSKILINQLMIDFPNNIYIDIGSNFDILINPTRDYMRNPKYLEIFMNTYNNEIEEEKEKESNIKITIKKGNENIKVEKNNIEISILNINELSIINKFDNEYYL